MEAFEEMKEALNAHFLLVFDEDIRRILDDGGDHRGKTAGDLL